MTFEGATWSGLVLVLLAGCSRSAEAPPAFTNACASDSDCSGGMVCAVKAGACIFACDPERGPRPRGLEGGLDRQLALTERWA